MNRHTPISDRIRDLGGDSDLVREVQKLEGLAAGNVSHVAANGRFPHWPWEKYVSVMQFLGLLIGGIWFAGSVWTGVQNDIAGLERSVSQLEETVRSLKSDLEHSNRATQLQIIDMLDQVMSSQTPRRPAPVFPRDSQFEAR